MSSTSENSFKRLRDEEHQHPQPPPEIEKNVSGTARSISFMGNVVELYIPRVFDVIFAFFGVNKKPEFENGESDADSDDTPKGNSKEIN